MEELVLRSKSPFLRLTEYHHGQVLGYLVPLLKCSFTSTIKTVTLQILPVFFFFFILR